MIDTFHSEYVPTSEQRAALESYEELGFVFCGVTSWAGGWLLIARDDDGAEVEVDELGARYGTTSPVSCESHQLDRHEPDC